MYMSYSDLIRTYPIEIESKLMMMVMRLYACSKMIQNAIYMTKFTDIPTLID